MSIADDVRRIVTSQDIATYALSAGYALKKTGEKVTFPQWEAIGTPKIMDKRVVHAEGKYSDGSILIFKLTESHGRKVVVGREKT